MAVAGYRGLAAEREGWLDRFAAGDLASLQSDKALMRLATPAAGRLFQDNCAACHGLTGEGGPGFPALADADWLWSGDPAEVALTIRDGINAGDASRAAEMPAFDWMDRADRDALAEYVAALPQGSADAGSPAAVLFAENCAACHGDGGAGGLNLGAPSAHRCRGDLRTGRNGAANCHTGRSGTGGHGPGACRRRRSTCLRST
ncbi:MAG: c-type cytochrome [Rhodospirillales bacterium]|nr:c-type cytochrome [Rhodospirillales bacterium]